jgi:RelE-like toxin of type II toxin-antitoxin system HigB
MEADIKAVQDRGESIGLMEPLLIPEDSRHRGALTDLAVELSGEASGFRSGLSPCVRAALAGLVRSMNCYYSNLIEGHDTHPVDIERALKNDYSKDPKKRALQLEAKAHITVQRWIDDGHLKGRAVSASGLCEMHKRFCEILPADMLWVEDPESHERLAVIPGELRKRDVKVAHHVAISPGAIPGLGDLVAPPVNRLEALRGDLAGKHLPRINDQWRIVFRWSDEGPEEVEIVDYH